MRALSLKILLALTVTACGGGSEDTRPAKLSTHIDDGAIVQVAMDQKATVVQTQNDWGVAKMENAKAEADYNAIGSQMQVVRNDRDKTKLQLSSAKSNKSTADASKDTNKINAATRDIHVAEMSVKAADLRIKYFETYRAYLKTLWRYTEENMYWREAQYENAKAQVAQKNNIAPKGLSFDSVSKQEQDRSKRAANRKTKLDSAKSSAMSARESWLKAQQTADQANGTPSNFADPMQSVPSTAGTN
ncbi:MAG: hypothetical protein ABI867_34725 [Kofleriaceae bacterium]